MEDSHKNDNSELIAMLNSCFEEKNKVKPRQEYKLGHLLDANEREVKRKESLKKARKARQK